ncbi:MFS transporter [Siccirubricoccus deserti]
MYAHPEAALPWRHVRLPDGPKPSSARRPWLILTGAFLAFTVGASAMHSYTVFLLAFVEEFGWSRAESSLAYSVGQLVGGFSSPLVGGMVDRFGARRMILLGGALLTLGLVGSAQADALWQIVLLYGVVMTFGANCVGLLVFVPLISGLFPTRRGMAIAVLQSANGFGRAVSAPVSQMLISGVGWRAAYLLEGAATLLLLLPLAALFGRGGSGAAATTARGTLRRCGTGRCRRRSAPRNSGCCSSSTCSPASAASWSRCTRSPSPSMSASTRSTPPACSAWAVSWRCRGDPDRHPFRLHRARGLGAAGLWYLHPRRGLRPGDHRAGPAPAALAARLLLRPDLGARGPAITAKTADLFPGPRLGTILGVITIGSGLGAALGAWAAGWIFDISGSYRAAFLCSIAAYLCGSIAFWALRRPPAPRAAVVEAD